MLGSQYVVKCFNKLTSVPALCVNYFMYIFCKIGRRRTCRVPDVNRFCVVFILIYGTTGAQFWSHRRSIVSICSNFTLSMAVKRKKLRESVSTSFKKAKFQPQNKTKPVYFVCILTWLNTERMCTLQTFHFVKIITFFTLLHLSYWNLLTYYYLNLSNLLSRERHAASIS